ncbi:5'-3' exonuclease [Tropheryma whipplei]|uniref:5'-3' exonuclease n=1 Tax=Tropheryma whipplei TaxID=2039 RepID=UPI00056DAD75|nr:5'-3' exonuclease H3TH domain-containing protein [Tropheryma whipplei]MCO8190216.1 DNA polymerase I [Tropheryma whipplei]
MTGTPDQSKRLILVDGHSLAFRSFYGTKAIAVVNGVQVNALYGFVNRLTQLLESGPVSHFAVAFDVSRKSFRTEAYPEYKGTRKKVPEEFFPQVDLIKEFLHLIGVNHFAVQNYEADDIIATLSRLALEEGFSDVRILSGDRDLIQLVNNKVSLLFFSAKHRLGFAVYTPEAVMDRYGIEPHVYPDMAALVGESSDNLPGIKKIGEKTATTLLQKYGCLQKIIESRWEISGVVGQNIRNDYHVALRNRKLNTLVNDLPLPASVSDLSLSGEIDTKKLEGFLRRYRMNSITPRLLRCLQKFTNAANLNRALTASPQRRGSPSIRKYNSKTQKPVRNNRISGVRRRRYRADRTSVQLF